MRAERCVNQTHTNMNVVIRHCPTCGEIVNGKIQKNQCDHEAHKKQLKNRNTFCYMCGKNLRDTL